MIKKLLILVMGFLVVAIGIVIFCKLLPGNKSDTQSIFVPSILPVGFTEAGKPQINVNFGNSIIQGFQNSENEIITFSQKVNPEFRCSPPPENSNSFSNFTKIIIQDGSEVCAVTVENIERGYSWSSGDIQFMLKVPVGSITDSDFEKFANSLVMKDVAIEVVSTAPEY